MRLLFHVLLEGGDPSPYALVVNASSHSIEECYRVEHGMYFSALDAYEHIKDKVASIEKVYCDPQDGPEAAQKFLAEMKKTHQRPEILFSKMPLKASDRPALK